MHSYNIAKYSNNIFWSSCVCSLLYIDWLICAHYVCILCTDTQVYTTFKICVFTGIRWDNCMYCLCKTYSLFKLFGWVFSLFRKHRNSLFRYRSEKTKKKKEKNRKNPNFLVKDIQICSLKIHVVTGIRARIFKRLWSPGIDSKEWIPPAYVAWRTGTITLFLLGA
jgi:hypothetical protein